MTFVIDSTEMGWDCDWWVSVPHFSDTVLIIVSLIRLVSLNEVESINDLWMGLSTSIIKHFVSKKRVFYLKQTFMLFFVFWCYFIFLLPPFHLIFGARRSSCIENGSWCLWWFYVFQLFTNTWTLYCHPVSGLKVKSSVLSLNGF